MEASVILFGIIDEHQRALDHFKALSREADLCFYASEIVSDLGYSRFSELEKSLSIISEVLATAQVPQKEHLQIIFRGEVSEIFRDWKLSALACHLLKIHGRTDNPIVANYQIETFRWAKA